MADALSAIVGFGTGIMNNQVSQYNAKKDFERQKELMRLSHQYSLQDFAIQNSYNSPKAQMQRLKDAGLNPDMVYGSGSIGTSDSSVPQRGTPGSSMAQTIPFTNPILDAVAAAQGMAAAKKAGAETIGQTIENQFNQKTLEDRVKSVSLQNGWTEQQTKKAVEETTNLQQQWNLLTGQINALSTDREIRQKELSQMDDRFKKEMREYDDKHKISHEEYRRLVNTYDDFKKMMENNASKSEWDAKMAELTYNIEADYKATEKNLGMIGQVIGLLLRALGK